VRRALRVLLAGGAYATESRTAFAAMTVQPTGQRKSQVDKLVRTLKDAGIWAKLDGLWLLAAHDSQAARVNFVTPSSVAAVTGTPTFVQDRGYAGDASAALLDLGLNLTTTAKATQNSHSAGVYSRTDSSVTGADIGTSELSINGKDTTPNYATRSASTSANGDSNSGTSIGMFSLSRTGSSGYTKYRDGGVIATKTQSSSSFTSQNVFLLARNGGSGSGAGFTARQISAAFVGGGLTDAEMATLNSAVQDYLRAVGAA
jgi:hypothetical protein